MRLTLFAKANHDVYDSLHSQHVNGVLCWNGINEIVRERYPGWSVRVRHETCARFDQLAAADGRIPEALARRSLALGNYGLASQFGGALYTVPADAVVLSLQPDLYIRLARHREEGFLFFPEGRPHWPEADRRWLHDAFEVSPLPDAAASMRSLETIVARLRAHRAVPVLVYNLSSVVPGDTVHCYAGLGETLSLRIRRFNLALCELSQRIGISVIDVDTIVARAGAAVVKLDARHLRAEGARQVAVEVVRVLDDLGCFDARVPMGGMYA
ncbi:MAG: hypothetical protein IT522_07645 [Burkholderiales bacterium]|nr:hypothetical protein [Burkholderiales bacterium]